MDTRDTPPQTARNEQICRLYVSGASAAACGRQFKLSRERVRQILRQAGVLKQQQLPTNRDEFLGVGVPQPLKDDIALEAERQNTSVSALVSDVLTEAVNHE